MSPTDVERARTAEAAERMYRERIRPLVDVPENLGKELVYDLNSGEFEIGETGLDAAERLKERMPDAVPVGRRIGYVLTISAFGRPRYVRE